MKEPKQVSKRTPRRSASEAEPASGLAGSPTRVVPGTGAEPAPAASRGASPPEAAGVVPNSVEQLFQQAVEHCARGIDRHLKLEYTVVEALAAHGHTPADIARAASARREQLVQEVADQVVAHEQQSAGAETWRALRRDWHQATLQMLPTDPRLHAMERAYLRAHRADQPRHQALATLEDLARATVRTGEAPLQARLLEMRARLDACRLRLTWLRGLIDGSAPWLSPTAPGEYARVGAEQNELEADIGALEARLARREAAVQDLVQRALEGARKRRHREGASPSFTPSQ